MKVFYIILITLFLYENNIEAQKIFVNEYDWNSEPVWQNASATSKESYIYLKNYFFLEYLKDADNTYYMYQTFHYMVYLADEKSVDVFNKVYIPFNNATNLINIKARTFTKDGKSTYFDIKNIKEAENLEDKGRYRLFALDGIEKGNMVEIFYTVKKKASLYGIIGIQKKVLSKDVLFQIASPKNIHFSTRVQNGEGVRCDSVSVNRRFISYYFDSVPGIEDEEYSNYEASLTMIDYKFNYNDQVNKSENYTYATAAQNLYDVLYSDWNTYSKKLKKIISELNIAKLSNDEKILSVDNYVKNNYLIGDNSVPNDESLEYILKNKAASELGTLTLYALLFKAADIEHQACFTSNRSELFLDPKFMSWSYLGEYLFYFPQTNKYLAPIHASFRYPMIPFQLMNNNALFIKTIEVGGIYSALPEVKKIPTSSPAEAYTQIDAKITFDDNFKSVNADIKYKYLGQLAMFIQPYYKFLDDEKRKKFVDEQMKTICDDIKVKSFTAANYSPNEPPVTVPFTLDVSTSATSLIEKAGDDYIIKIGKILGKQSQLYAKSERKLDIDIFFPHTLTRNITVVIPNGYQVKGNEKIEFNIVGNNMKFESKCKIEGSSLIVNINEEYNTLNYPKSEYATFRNVINAAADFYDSVIILKKL